MPDLFEPTHRLGEVRDEERLRLLLVIDAEAGSDHADREAERLGPRRFMACLIRSTSAAKR